MGNAMGEWNSIISVNNPLHRRARGYRISSIFEKERPDYRFSWNSTDALRKKLLEFLSQNSLIEAVPRGTKPFWYEFFFFFFATSLTGFWIFFLTHLSCTTWFRLTFDKICKPIVIMEDCSYIILESYLPHRRELHATEFWVFSKREAWLSISPILNRSIYYEK